VTPDREISETVPSTNEFTYDTEDGPVTVEAESYTTFAEVKYTTRARALTLSMFVINWVLTLCSLVVTVTVADRREMPSGVTLLPVTTILSIPAIRSLYIGSPPFGVRLGTHWNRATPHHRIDIAL